MDRIFRPVAAVLMLIFAAAVIAGAAEGDRAPGKDPGKGIVARKAPSRVSLSAEAGGVFTPPARAEGPECGEPTIAAPLTVFVAAASRHRRAPPV